MCDTKRSNDNSVYVVINFDWCNRAPHCTTERGKESGQLCKEQDFGYKDLSALQYMLNMETNF